MIALTEDEFTKELRLSDTINYLDLSFCSLIDDTALELICKRLPKLYSLVLTGCSQITDEGVNMISTFTPYISYLNLGHCHKITDKVIYTISFPII